MEIKTYIIAAVFFIGIGVSIKMLMSENRQLKEDNIVLVEQLKAKDDEVLRITKSKEDADRAFEEVMQQLSVVDTEFDSIVDEFALLVNGKCGVKQNVTKPTNQVKNISEVQPSSNDHAVIIGVNRLLRQASCNANGGC